MHLEVFHVRRRMCPQRYPLPSQKNKNTQCLAIIPSGHISASLGTPWHQQISFAYAFASHRSDRPSWLWQKKKKLVNCQGSLICGQKGLWPNIESQGCREAMKNGCIWKYSTWGAGCVHKGTPSQIQVWIPNWCLRPKRMHDASGVQM
jgi:hypothetical protein